MRTYKKNELPGGKIRRIGIATGAEVEKFMKLKRTAAPAASARTRLIRECYANLECKLVDGRLIQTYNCFIFEVVKAHAARAPNSPRTVHFRGDGIFMISGPSLNERRKFKPEMLV